MSASTIPDILDLLSHFSGGRLRDAAALGRFLEEAEPSEKAAEIGELAFHGRYLTRLLDTMKKQTAQSEHFPGLEAEFTRAVNNYQELIRVFAAGCSDGFFQFCEQHYFAVSEAALQHLLALAYDFAWLKEWEVAMATDGEETAA